jgi:hypothetical protein
MLITVVRRRLTFLIGVLVTAVVLGVLGYSEIPVVSTVGRAVLVLLLLLFPLQWYTVLGPFGMVLRPDGVLDRQPRGSIFVPREAGAAAEPTRNGVKLSFARPDLVVRRGFRPGTTIRTGADPGFTAWAINLYAARPDFRTTIGTDEGLLRLTA